MVETTTNKRGGHTNLVKRMLSRTELCAPTCQKSHTSNFLQGSERKLEWLSLQLSSPDCNIYLESVRLQQVCVCVLYLTNLMPRSKAWKHNDAEDADAAEFAASGDMPTVSPERLSHGQTAFEPASRGG